MWLYQWCSAIYLRTEAHLRHTNVGSCEIPSWIHVGHFIYQCVYNYHWNTKSMLKHKFGNQEQGIKWILGILNDEYIDFKRLYSTETLKNAGIHMKINMDNFWLHYKDSETKNIFIQKVKKKKLK